MRPAGSSAPLLIFRPVLSRWRLVVRFLLFVASDRCAIRLLTFVLMTLMCCLSVTVRPRAAPGPAGRRRGRWGPRRGLLSPQCGWPAGGEGRRRLRETPRTGRRRAAVTGSAFPRSKPNLLSFKPDRPSGAIPAVGGRSHERRCHRRRTLRHLKFPEIPQRDRVMGHAVPPLGPSGYDAARRAASLSDRAFDGPALRREHAPREGAQIKHPRADRRGGVGFCGGEFGNAPVGIFLIPSRTALISRRGAASAPAAAPRWPGPGRWSRPGRGSATGSGCWSPRRSSCPGSPTVPRWRSRTPRSARWSSK